MSPVFEYMRQRLASFCLQATVQLDSTKFFFTNDVVRVWNKLPPSVMQCDTINSTIPSTKVSDKSKLPDILQAT